MCNKRIEQEKKKPILEDTLSSNLLLLIVKPSWTVFLHGNIYLKYLVYILIKMWSKWDMNSILDLLNLHGLGAAGCCKSESEWERGMRSPSWVSLSKLLHIFEPWFPQFVQKAWRLLFRIVLEIKQSHVKSTKHIVCAQEIRSFPFPFSLGFEDRCKLFYTFGNTSFSKCNKPPGLVPVSWKLEPQTACGVLGRLLPSPCMPSSY